jgi:hypothetical protein
MNIDRRPDGGLGMRFLVNLAFSATKTFVLWGAVTVLVYLGTYWLQAGVGLKQYLSALASNTMSDVYDYAIGDLYFWQAGLGVLALLALFDKCLLVVSALLSLDDERRALDRLSNDEWRNP